MSQLVVFPISSKYRQELGAVAIAFCLSLPQLTLGAQSAIAWQKPGTSTTIAGVSTLPIPTGCVYAGPTGTKQFMEMSQNPVSGREAGVLYCGHDSFAGTLGDGTFNKQDFWFVIFEWDASGYVRDTERGSLDADAILKSIRSGTEEANMERRSRGWPTMEIDGWVTKPFYDSRTNNLTWAMRAKSSDGAVTANHSVRLLGRLGVMHAELVSDASTLEANVAQFDQAIASVSFVSGQRYAEFRSGDKVAEYGLTALVAGGAGAAAMKLGLFGKLWKFVAGLFVAVWKLIAIAVAGLLASIKKLFGRDKPRSDT